MDDEESGLNTERNKERRPYSETSSRILYTVQESPPRHLCILFSFQHILAAFGSLISLPIILSKFYCMENDYVALSEIIGTVFFVSGIVTFLQTTFGIRLPIVQGVSASFLTPIISILNQPQWKCPYTEAKNKYDVNVTFTDVGLPAVDSPEHQEIWQKRIREVQGAIMIASLFQMTTGFTGVMGFALRYFGPLVITPTLTLIGLSLFQTGAAMVSQQWWVALMTILFITVFSQYLRKAKMHCLSCGNKTTETSFKLPLFTLFPTLTLTIVLLWCIGALEERGIVAWLEDDTTNTEAKRTRREVYDLPLIQQRLSDISVISYFPICPSFSKGKKKRSQRGKEEKLSVSDGSDLKVIGDSTLDLAIDKDT